MPWPFHSNSCCRALSDHSPGSGKSRTLPPASTSPLSAPRAALPAAHKTRGSSSHHGPDGTHSWSWSISSSKPLQNTLTGQDTDSGVSRMKLEPLNLKIFQGFPLTPEEHSILEQSFSYSSNIWPFPHFRHEEKLIEGRFSFLLSPISGLIQCVWDRETSYFILIKEVITLCHTEGTQFLIEEETESNSHTNSHRCCLTVNLRVNVNKGERGPLILTWNTTRDFSSRYWEMDVPTTMPLSTRQQSLSETGTGFLQTCVSADKNLI